MIHRDNSVILTLERVMENDIRRHGSGYVESFRPRFPDGRPDESDFFAADFPAVAACGFSPQTAICRFRQPSQGSDSLARRMASAILARVRLFATFASGRWA